VVWRLFIAGAVAVAAVTAIWTFGVVGHGAANATKTVALMPVTMPVEAAEAAASADVRAAIPAVEAFYADHGTYASATIGDLRAIDSGIDSSVRLGWTQSGSYCIESTVESRTASETGPGGDVIQGGC